LSRNTKNANPLHVLWHYHSNVLCGQQATSCTPHSRRIGNDKAVFSIEDGKLLAGKFPTNKTRLVQAWIEIRREELNANWKLAVNGEEVFKVDPLK